MCNMDVKTDYQQTPIPGVTIRVDGTTRTAIANNEGQFTITEAPIGPVHLIADGSTATVPGEYPDLSYNIVTVSGAENPLASPIYMVKLNTDSAVYAGLEDVEVTVPDMPGFKLEVAKGSVTFPDGAKEGYISITPVNINTVPMVPPNGIQPQMIVTIQPTGARFDPPAPFTVPNVDAQPPGKQLEMYSYDHDLEEFVAIGLGEVSEDGTVIKSKPSVGVIKAGWHMSPPPPPPTGTGNKSCTNTSNLVPDDCRQTKCGNVIAANETHSVKNKNVCMACEGMSVVPDASLVGEFVNVNKCEICDPNGGGIKRNAKVNNVQLTGIKDKYKVNEEITFDAFVTPDCPGGNTKPIYYEWDLGIVGYEKTAYGPFTAIYPQPGTYTISVKASCSGYKIGDQCSALASKVITIEQTVDYLEAVDANDSTRRASSGDTLQMVGDEKNAIIRKASITAIPKPGMSFGAEDPTWKSSASINTHVTGFDGETTVTWLKPNPGKSSVVANNDVSNLLDIEYVSGKERKYNSDNLKVIYDNIEKLLSLTVNGANTVENRTFFDFDAKATFTPVDVKNHPYTDESLVMDYKLKINYGFEGVPVPGWSLSLVDNVLEAGAFISGFQSIEGGAGFNWDKSVEPSVFELTQGKSDLAFNSKLSIELKALISTHKLIPIGGKASLTASALIDAQIDVEAIDEGLQLNPSLSIGAAFDGEYFYVIGSEEGFGRFDTFKPTWANVWWRPDCTGLTSCFTVEPIVMPLK